MSHGRPSDTWGSSGGCHFGLSLAITARSIPSTPDSGPRSFFRAGSATTGVPSVVHPGFGMKASAALDKVELPTIQELQTLWEIVYFVVTVRLWEDERTGRRAQTSKGKDL